MGDAPVSYLQPGLRTDLSMAARERPGDPLEILCMAVPSRLRTHGGTRFRPDTVGPVPESPGGVFSTIRRGLIHPEALPPNFPPARPRISLSLNPDVPDLASLQPGSSLCAVTSMISTGLGDSRPTGGR